MILVNAAYPLFLLAVKRLQCSCYFCLAGELEGYLPINNYGARFESALPSPSPLPALYILQRL